MPAEVEAKHAVATAAPMKCWYYMESSSGKIRQSSYNHAASPLARALPTPGGATQSSVVVRILLTHSPEALALYYGERALKGLQNLGEVRLHEGKQPLQGEQLIRAAENCEIIVSYRQSPGPAEVFQRLPQLVAFVRCAIDIRNIDVAAASEAGVLVTQASAGFRSEEHTSELQSHVNL